MKNAEISQSEERLKQELRNESHELSEVYEQLQKVQTTLQTKTKEIDGLNLSVTELHGTIQNQEDQIQAIEEMKIDIIDKNKVRTAGDAKGFFEFFHRNLTLGFDFFFRRSKC